MTDAAQALLKELVETNDMVDASDRAAAAFELHMLGCAYYVSDVDEGLIIGLPNAHRQLQLLESENNL